VQFGAEEKILYEAHPHIGTNKLPHIIIAMRKQIEDSGGQFLFEKKVVDFIIEKEKIRSIKTADDDTFEGNAVILATGHSARDIFELLHSKQILIEAKPFALGVRIEHPQTLIDNIQYHCAVREEHLPPASYSLVQQVNNKGVFSFCMCPGGIVAPAATAPGELVVNGWSPSKRNNPFANSGMVVEVGYDDLKTIKDFETVSGRSKDVLDGPLGMMYFQQYVERKVFAAGDGNFVAPAQRMIDFSNGKLSASLPDNSYLPGLKSGNPKVAGKQSRIGSMMLLIRLAIWTLGFLIAVVIATESRTSSPVRIPRDNETLAHPQIKNLYPCGEGAGYAGGIVSAAMDGERIALLLAEVL